MLESRVAKECAEEQTEESISDERGLGEITAEAGEQGGELANKGDKVLKNGDGSGFSGPYGRPMSIRAVSSFLICESS